MPEEPVALFLRVVVIDKNPRIVRTGSVNAAPVWISISKGCYDSAFCIHIEGLRYRCTDLEVSHECLDSKGLFKKDNPLSQLVITLF